VGALSTEGNRYHKQQGRLLKKRIMEEKNYLERKEGNFEPAKRESLKLPFKSRRVKSSTREGREAVRREFHSSTKEGG